MTAASLSPTTLDWVAHAVPRRRLLHIHRLPGSTSASLYRLNFGSGPDTVLRQFDVVPEWLRAEPDLAWHETRSLKRAAQAGLPTPTLVAFDGTGAEAGCPSVPMTCLPGEVNLKPPNLNAWLSGLAAALARIHAVSPTGFAWTHAPYADLGPLSVSTWTTAPRAWASALERLREPPPTFVPTFIHRDFHPANVLWQAGQLSGVVDWVNACAGPAGADVGHCRVNLAQMYGLGAADAFKAAYQRRTGHIQNPYWDLLSLVDLLNGDQPPTVYPGWPAFGLTSLTDELIRTRLDGYLLSLLRSESRSGAFRSN